jgi:cytochrome c
MRLHFVAALGSAALAIGLLSAVPARAQDADAGKVTFKQKCSVCHNLTPGARGLGPSLFGAVGSKAGTNDASFHYSDAIKGSGKTWDAASLDTYLTNPRADIPGVKMTFVGLPVAADRANVIAFITTLKK